jgi:hypothetical protein
MATDNPRRLSFAGPTDPKHGYPMWFEDENGLRLELVTNADPFAPAIADLPDPDMPLAFPGNFPDESFYFMAEAQLTVGGNGIQGRARVIMALEAAFGGNGEPAVGANVVFARIRVRMDDLIPGEKYVVTHPYGVTPELEADDKGRVFETYDLGLTEGDCTAVLKTGRVAPFLTWDAGAPPKYIGDGVTDHLITGSPFGTNFVEISGARIGEGSSDAVPGDINKVRTDKFSIQGRIAQRLGVAAEAVTYESTAAGTMLNVHARSAPGQTIELAGSGIRIQLAGAERHYTGRAQVAAIPADLQLINASDIPPTRTPVVAVDQVLVQSVTFDISAQTLTVKAQSSDPTASLTLQPLNLPFTAPQQAFNGIAAMPASIQMVSDKGGTGVQQVQVIGATAPNLGVAASAAPPAARAVVGQAFELDGLGSRGATSFAWSQASGPPGALTQQNQPVAQFVATAIGIHQFQLTVQGDGGPSSALVDVEVFAAPPPDVLSIELAQYRTNRRQYRISGTVSNFPNVITVRVNGMELGKTSPDITLAWDFRLTLETGPDPDVNSVVEVISKSGVQTTTLQIRR